MTQETQPARRAANSAQAPNRNPETEQPIPSAGDDNLGWYLVHTKLRQEDTALASLERQGYYYYLPQLRIEKIRRRKAEVVTEPMFPRYLFIRLDTSANAKSWSPIRSTLGVCQLVQFGCRPAKVDNLLVDMLRKREEVSLPETLFQRGDAILITDGPFSGIEATYQMVDAEQRSLVLLDLLSKAVRVQIDTANLMKVK